MADLETANPGSLLTRDRTFLEPYEAARRDYVSVLGEARRVAEPGREDELVELFARDLDTWITTIAQPQIAGGFSEHAEHEYAISGKLLSDRMRVTLGKLRDERSPRPKNASGQPSKLPLKRGAPPRPSIVIAIGLALAAGVAIARDVARATAQLQAALAATGRLEELPTLPVRRDELARWATVYATWPTFFARRTPAPSHPGRARSRRWNI